MRTYDNNSFQSYLLLLGSKQHRDAVPDHLVSPHLLPKIHQTHHHSNPPISGDSYTQTDFDSTVTDPALLPNPANPLGNPAFPGHTTSGGPNWLGPLVTTHNKTLLLAYNFAYGGATTDADLVVPFAPDVLSFVDQVAEFRASVAGSRETAPWTSENTLFGVWMGINDVGNTYYQDNVTDILDAIMVRYFAQLQVMYDAGGRNFVLLSVPREFVPPWSLSPPPPVFLSFFFIPPG